MYYINTDELEDDSKVQCPKCAANGGDKSQDNFHFFSKEDGGYCFKCSFTIPSEEYKEETNSNLKAKGNKNMITSKDIDNLKNKALTAEQVAEIEAKTFTDIPKPYRGVPSEVYKGLGVRWEKNGNEVSMYYPITVVEDGNERVVGYKIRKHPKEFYSVGYVGKLGGFLNQSNAVADTLILTAGECFTEDTEVMTDRGFVSFSDLLDTDLVLQVDESLVGTYVKPLARVKKKYVGDLIYQKTATTNSLTTPNHNLVFKNKFGEIFKQKAHEHVNTNWSIPKHVVVNGKGTGLSKDEIKLVIAICADGSLRNRVEGNNVAHFGFMKKRKIERLQGILHRLDISYSSYTNTYQNGKTYTTFNFRMPDYLETKELPQSWLVDASLDERLFILEEIRYWDGYYDEDRKSTEFTSKHFEEVSYIQQLAHTSGMYASTAHRTNQFGEWYRCMISGNNMNTTTQTLSKSKVSHNGYVYCVTVPTGMILTRHDGRVVVSGNCDLATVVYAMENDKYRKSYNVVSSSLGEDSTAAMIKLNYEWINSHKKIICALDNDEAGNLAFEKVKAVVDTSKLFRAALRYKDANEYLKNGDMTNLVADVYWNAQPVVDYGIAGSGDIYNEIIKTVKTESIALPNFLSDLKPVFKGGIPLQEIILLAAASSIGKSAIVNQIMLDWIMTSVHKVLILSFEDTMGTLGAKIASKVSGHNILAMETTEEKLEVLEKYKPEINKYLYTESGEHRFNVIERIPESIDDLKEAIIQSIRLYNSKILIIDPISSLFSDKTNEEQASFMKFLETVKNKYGCTILMSTHTRKGSSGQKDKGEGASFGEDEIRGSSVLVGVSTIVMLLSRDKMASDPIERNTTKISVSKNRTYSITARDIAKIYYSPQHHTLFSYNYAEANGFFLDTSAEELKEILDNTKAAKLVTNEEDEMEIIDVF